MRKAVFALAIVLAITCVFMVVTASAKPAACHTNSPNVGISQECNDAGTGRDVTIDGLFNAGDGYRGTVQLGSPTIWGTTVFTGPITNHPYSWSGELAVGSYTVVATLEQFVNHPAVVHYDCPVIDWTYGSHNVQVPYEKSNDPHKCHRPSDSDLHDDYGMGSSERHAFKDDHSEWIDSIEVVDTPAWSEWVVVDVKQTDFVVDPCPPKPCSSVGDWTLVGDAPEWVVASDLLSRTKTFNYAKYDLIYQGVCDTKTETLTDTWVTYCLNGITGQGWLSELPAGATEGACGTRPVCTGQGTIFIDIGAPLPEGAAEGYCGHEITYCLNGQTTVLKWDDSQQTPEIPEGATLGACVPVEPQPTPIPPPVTGGSGGPGGSPLAPFAGTALVGLASIGLFILGLAMKPRKAGSAK